MPNFFVKLWRWTWITARPRWRMGRIREMLRYSFRRTREPVKFCIVSHERNAGEAAIKCLDSVYNQDYDRGLIRQIILDDSSTDNTQELIRDWLEKHPDNNVEYIRQDKRIGACANGLIGFQKAGPGSVVLELDGDDWFPDRNVLKFYNKVFQDPETWMTYNSFIFYYGKGRKTRRCSTLGPIPKKVIAENAFRNHLWKSCHMQAFRAELISPLDNESLIDSETGEYLETGDDKALYYSLLELAGFHSQHVYRTTYIYNVRDRNELSTEEINVMHERDRRIVAMEKYKPLERLSVKRVT